MLNKNDPLIAAVQKVMQTNQAERDAVSIVNEKFGVTDRRVLPRERQHEWDSAYAKVLAEGVEALDEKKNMSKVDIAALRHPKKKITGDDLAALRAGEHKMEEAKKMKDDPCWDNYRMVGMKKKGNKEVPNCVPIKEQANPEKDPYREQQAGSVETMPVPKPKPKPVIGNADREALTNKIKSVVKEATEKQRRMDESASLQQIHEEIAYNLAEQAAYILENQGEDALLEFYMSLTDEQREIAEGWMDSLAAGARGAWNSATLDGGKFVRAGADYLAKNAAAKLGYGKGTTYSKELDQEREKDVEAQTKNPTAYNVGSYGADAALLATGAGGLAKLGAKGALKLGMKSAEKLATRSPSTIGKTVDAVGSKAFKTGVAGHAGGAVSGQHKGLKDVGLEENIVGDMFRAGIRGGARLLGYGDDVAKATSGVPKIASSGPRGRMPKKGPWGSATSKNKTKAQAVQQKPAQSSTVPQGTMAARAQQLAQAGKKAQASRTGTSTVAATQTAARAKAAKQAQGARVGGGTVNATQTAARAKAAQQVQSGRVAVTSPKQSIVQKAVTIAKNNKTAIAAGVGGAALGAFGASQLNKPPSTQASTPSAGVSARKIEANPRKVSDTEIMNAPQFKQAVSDVGGPDAARRIKPGTDVAGVGKVEKGQTIWSKVKSQLEKQPVKGFEARKGGGGR